MSDTDGKIKLIKNPGRNKPTPYKPYVPQYQIHDKEPAEYQSAIVPSGTQIAKPSTDNPRLKRAPVRQPYAEATASPIGRGRGPVPNVGNNMEHTWSSVDGDIIDDLSEFDSNQPMIDNNDEIALSTLGFQHGTLAQDITQETKFFPPSSLEQGEMYSPDYVGEYGSALEGENLYPILNDLVPDAFLLIVSGVAICSGPKEEIEDQARALVCGEHDLCEGNPIPIDDIIILKRVKVKIGLFLE